jgi:hypothetical protein
MRRASHEALTKRAVQKYHPILEKEATILLSSLLTPSANLEQDRHFKRLAVSSIMSVVYDYPTIMSEHDNTIEYIEKALERVVHAMSMGSYFVDIFPWMKHIPERCWLSFRFLDMDTDGRTQSDSRNGSGMAYNGLQRTLRYSEAF